MSEILWVDSHCHPQYESLNLDSIKEAYDNHIARICCVGTAIKEHEFLIQAKEKYKVAISLGEHPLNDFEYADWEFLENNLHHYNAVGEIGFDFQNDIAPQIEAFQIQANLAKKYNLPIILHIRDSGDGKIEDLIIEQLQQFPGLKGVFHCFVGTKKLANFAIENGFFVSFSGIITFKKSEALREVLPLIPMDLMLIETDAPYLAPVPYRGKSNHPMYVKYIGEFIAQFLSLDLHEFSHHLIKNFDDLYEKKA